MSRPPSTATKLIALTRKQTPTPAKPRRIPATDGPRIRDALKRLELSAIAFGSVSRPTIRYVSCWRDGASSTRIAPFTNAIA